MNTSAYVEAGAAWLDTVEPGWWQEVDIEALDMSHCSDCMIGQLYGDYEILYDEMHHSWEWSQEHGFTGEDYGSQDPRWLELKDLWIEQITQRREKNHEASVQDQ